MRIPPRSWLYALGLLAACAGLCGSALSALRAERLRHAQAEDGARLLLAQKIAADAQRALQDLRRAAELLASDASIRALLGAPTAAERRLGAERLAAAAARLDATSVRVRDAGGRWLADAGDAGNGPVAAAASPRHAAAVAVHVALAEPGGELVVVVPLRAIFDDIETGGLGACSVSASDGRVVLDEEGARAGIVLDVAGGDVPHALREAGLSTTATGRSFAFALVPSVPLLVCIEDPGAATAALPRAPLLIGGAVLALSVLAGLVRRTRG